MIIPVMAMDIFVCIFLSFITCSNNGLKEEVKIKKLNILFHSSLHFSERHSHFKESAGIM